MQVFVKGLMHSGEGRFIDLKNAQNPLATDACGEFVAKLCKGTDLMPSFEGIAKAPLDPQAGLAKCQPQVLFVDDG